MKRLAKFAIIITIMISIVGGGFAFKRRLDKQKEKAMLAEFMSEREKHADALAIMDATIGSSKEIGNYYTYNGKPTKKKERAES